MFDLGREYTSSHPERIATTPKNGRELCKTLAHIKNMQGYGYKKWLNITEQLVKMEA